MRFFILMIFLFAISVVLAQDVVVNSVGDYYSEEKDVLVFQGQYYEGGELMVGTYYFEFRVYDDKEEGDLVYYGGKNISTGEFGEWYVELEGLFSAARDSDKSYFIEISINGEIQGERRRITDLDFLRRDGKQVVGGETIFSSGVNVSGVSYFSDVEVSGKEVCLSDGTNCLGVDWENLSGIPESFIDGVDNDSVLNDSDILGMGYLKEEADPVFVLENESIWSRINFLFGLFENYYDKNEVLELIPAIDLSPYVLKSELNYFSGSWSDLTDRPEIPVDTRLSEDEVDLMVGNNGYLTSYLESDPVWNLEKGNYVLKSEFNDSLFGKDDSGKIPVVFYITMNGDLRRSDRYLPLGTNVVATAYPSEASWIIGKDLVITDIIWNSYYNSRWSYSAIVLEVSDYGKWDASFYEVDRVVISGEGSGEVSGLNAAYSAGDLMAVKYDASGGSNSETIRDLSVTLVGYYA